MTSPGPEALVEVRLVALPVPEYRRAAEHNDELLREFALIEDLHRSTGGVPGRLTDLMGELRRRFGAFTARPQADLQEALAAGKEAVDIAYQVPAAARDAAVALDRLLDEADEFCRSGEELLTLATPPGALALRRWFLGEFVAQIDGASPTPWPEWVGSAPPQGRTPPRR